MSNYKQKNTHQPARAGNMSGAVALGNTSGTQVSGNIVGTQVSATSGAEAPGNPFPSVGSASSGGLVAAALSHSSAISLESIEYEDQKRDERFMHYLNETEALEDNEQSSEDEIDSASEDYYEETERFTISNKEPGPLAVSGDDYDPWEDMTDEELLIGTLLSPQNEKTERFTISNKESGPLAVTLREDDDDDTDCVCHPRVNALKKNASCFKRYQDEARPKSRTNKRVQWAPTKQLKTFYQEPVAPDYWQSERDTEKARKERKSEQFWKIPYRWNINENQWRSYCKDRE